VAERFTPRFIPRFIPKVQKFSEKIDILCLLMGNIREVIDRNLDFSLAFACISTVHSAHPL
jgi:hypothetical protein